MVKKNIYIILSLILFSSILTASQKRAASSDLSNAPAEKRSKLEASEKKNSSVKETATKEISTLVDKVVFKEPVMVDSFNLNNTEIISQQTFAALIQQYIKLNKKFIIAKVVTESKGTFCANYYDAHNLNQHLWGYPISDDQRHLLAFHKLNNGKLSLNPNNVHKNPADILPIISILYYIYDAPENTFKYFCNMHDLMVNLPIERQDSKILKFYENFIDDPFDQSVKTVREKILLSYLYKAMLAHRDSKYKESKILFDIIINLSDNQVFIIMPTAYCYLADFYNRGLKVVDIDKEKANNFINLSETQKTNLKDESEFKLTTLSADVFDTKKNKAFLELLANQTVNLQAKAEAQWRLVEIEFNGNGDLKQVLHIAQLAENQTNNILAKIKTKFMLCQMYYSGSGVAKDRQKAHDYAQLVSNQLIDLVSKAGADLLLSKIYFAGLASVPNYPKAHEYAKLAADQKKNLFAKAGAELVLCKIYFSGLGVTKNCAKALEYAQLAADHDQTSNPFVKSEAASILGFIYFHGLGISSHDYKKAHDYAKLAADQKENQNAKFSGESLLSQIYFYGLGTAKDLAKAYQLAKSVGEQKISPELKRAAENILKQIELINQNKAS